MAPCRPSLFGPLLHHVSMDHPLVVHHAGMPRQYAGLLQGLGDNKVRFPFSFIPRMIPLLKVVSRLPIIWFYEDDSGGWTYLTLRLGMSNLKMEDTGSSPCHVCALKLLKKLVRLGILAHP